jgi:hypothetical protein
MPRRSKFCALFERALIVLGIAILFSPSSLASGPNTPAPTANDRTPVQAELLRAIEAGRIRVGDPVFAKVNLAWKNSACPLREGAILKGRIVSQTPRFKGSRSSEVSILFESGQCGGRDMKPLPLTLAALLAPDPATDVYGEEESQPLNEAVGVGLGGGSGGMRSLSQAAANTFVEPRLQKPPQLVMPGQVIGLPDIKLQIGAGPEGSTVLSCEKRTLRLESGSRFVLVPTMKPAPDASTAGAPASPDAAAATPPPEPETVAIESEVCAPPTCSLALAPSETETSAAAAFSIPVKSLGFAAAADRQMYSLDHDVTISYLGPGKLLFTFNPHVLVPRSNAEAALPRLHIVRASLIDLKTMKTERTVDWRIHDAQQYLWTMGRDRVLVHVGGELRLYGSELRLLLKINLGGPLAFVTISPSGAYLAVGVIKERHTEAIHKELAEAEAREPEEDVELKILDSGFRTVATVMRSSRLVAPVLSDDGEIRVPTIGKDRWRIVEYDWTGQRRVLKQVESTCRPEASTVAPDLLFLTGCDRLADGKWYAVLRQDGRLLLKGRSPSSEQGQTVGGSLGTGMFAVGITELTKALDPSAAFRASDLKELHIGVYGAQNGKKLIGVNLPDPLPTVQTFALSPDGRQMAVLANHQIVFYELPGVADISN